MNKRKRRKRKTVISVTAVILIVNITVLTFVFRMRPVIIGSAESAGERILINAANEALIHTLNESEITYDDIVELSTDSSGRVTSVEIDAVALNLLKSRIALTMSEIVSSQENYSTYIPLGTFLGSEFTSGLGPKIEFQMQIATSSVVDIKSEFIEAGLNQAVHRISLVINMSGRLIMSGISDSFTASTNAVIAETVIVGITPDAFTQVIGSGESDIADDISNYGAAAE